MHKKPTTDIKITYERAGLANARRDIAADKSARVDNAGHDNARQNKPTADTTFTIW